ncbi:MAG: membrane lipoprotein lipid attachment site-containing protein [Victivallales bacterium]|nr:membrane lipoprotein lipid attachment site-containing protein [Victivallales bacterium]
MKKTISIIVIAAVVAGCSSVPEKEPRPITTVLTGKNVDNREFPSIRGYEIVKTYYLGRRLDPHNPNIMYEAGKMYVVRRSPAWNLRPHSPPVGDQLFANRIRPLKSRQENMKKQQELQERTLAGLKEVGRQLLANRKEIEEISRKQAGEDLASGIREIQQSQGQIKRKMAEFEQ